MPGSDDKRPDQVQRSVPDWDAVAVMRQRADKARRECDAAIEELRESVSEEEILTEFGINLDEVEG